MKTILIIGVMNDLVKSINTYLKQFFDVQICNEETKNATSLIRVTEPDLIFISLIGFTKADDQLFYHLHKAVHEIPVVTHGTPSEHDIFEVFYEEDQFSHVSRPASNDYILAEICRRLGLDENELKASHAENADTRKKVLVVDDDATALRSVKGMLENKYNVTLANSGMKAMVSMGKSVPDVIILDYEMPVCDGKMTMEMIKADESLCNIPVIFLTGINERKNIEAVLRLLPAGYLLKPVAPDLLIAQIEKALGRA
ncbi:MAG: response regulator [Lachnospiraceae bacterium]|nr:response regulator [Lachnospiraceae bacterium]